MRKLFKLVGEVTIEGMNAVNKGLATIDKDAKAVGRTIDQFGQNVTKAGIGLTKTFTAPIVGLTGAMVLLANNTGQYADKLLDLKEITGLSTDNLQGLERVARVAGVNFDGLTVIVQKLTSRLPQLIKEGGAATGAFRALGYSEQEVLAKSKDMNSFLPEIINKLQGIENITDRNVIAQQIFGKELKDLAPILGMSAEKFNKLLGSSKDMAGYMSEDALKAAYDYRLSVKDLEAEFFGLWRELSTKFIPILNDTVIPLIQSTVMPVFRAFVKVVGDVANWFNNLSKPMKETVVIFGATLAAIGPVVVITGKLIATVKLLTPLYVALIKKQLTLNAVMSANPIGVVVVAIGLLIAAGIALYKNWDAVKNGLLDAWDAIGYYTTQAITQIKVMFLSLVKTYLDGISEIAKYIPKLNTAVDSARESIAGMIEKGKEEVAYRKAARAEMKLQKAATEEVVAVVEKAKEATTQYNLAEMNVTKAKNESVKATKEQKVEEEDLSKKRAEFEADWTKKHFYATSTRLEQLEYERQEALRIAEELGADRTAIEKYYALQRGQIEEQAEKEKSAYLKSLRHDAYNQAMKLMADINRVRVENIDAELAKEKEAITSSKMSEEEKAAAIAALEEEADKKKKDLAKKAAIREKAAGIFSVVISTAQAVMKAVAQLGPIVGGVAGGVMAALGVAQAAVIAAKPLPFAKGGLVKGGKGGVVGEIGEKQHDEIVFPLKTGIEMLVDGLLDRIGQIALPSMGGMAAAGGGETHLHIGTLIADERGIKNLERTLRKYRIAENQRTGYAV